jgi:hypothetical protein
LIGKNQIDHVAVVNIGQRLGNSHRFSVRFDCPRGTARTVLSGINELRKRHNGRGLPRLGHAELFEAQSSQSGKRALLILVFAILILILTILILILAEIPVYDLEIARFAAFWGAIEAFQAI